MYSIGEVSKQTGIPASTLRYYETIGLLPNPPQRHDGRKNGIRQYDDADVQFLHFIHGLKQTGMTLQDIGTFAEDGCLLTEDIANMDVEEVLQKRMKILNQHLEQLEQQMQRLQDVKRLAEEKRTFYKEMLKQWPCEKPPQNN